MQRISVEPICFCKVSSQPQWHWRQFSWELMRDLTNILLPHVRLLLRQTEITAPLCSYWHFVQKVWSRRPWKTAELLLRTFTLNRHYVDYTGMSELFNDVKYSHLLDWNKNLMKRFLCAVTQFCFGRRNDAATTFLVLKDRRRVSTDTFQCVSVHLYKCVSWSVEARWALPQYTVRKIHRYI